MFNNELVHNIYNTSQAVIVLPWSWSKDILALFVLGFLTQTFTIMTTNVSNMGLGKKLLRAHLCYMMICSAGVMEYNMNLLL